MMPQRKPCTPTRWPRPVQRILYFAVILAAVLASASCRSGDRVYIIKAALSQNPGQPQVRAAELFKRLVEQGTQGRVRVDIYPNNQLGNQRDVIEGIQLGTVEMSNVAAPLASFVPQLNLFELPFLFESREHFHAVLDSEIGRGLAPNLEARGFRLLGFFDAGVRHIMTTHRPINTLEDLRGLKIRTMENPLHLAAFKALGANPLPMAYGELYTALEQGVIDGAEAAGPNYLAKKFYEPAPHWAQVGWIHLVEYVVMSRVFYERLPQPYRDVVDRAAGEMILRERQWYREAEAAAQEELERAGALFSYPDREPFRRAARLVYLEWADRVGGLPLIERILSFPHRQRPELP